MEDGPEPSSSKLLSTPLSEDDQQRLQWIAHLEFSHNKEASELTWDNVAVTLPRTGKLRNMVRAGIPHSLRPQIWMRLSGALQKKMNSETTYHDIVKASCNDQLITSKQIEKDLLRIMPTNACFSSPNGTGVPRLRRILRGIAWLFPDIGYCQGTGVIAASLLLLMEEEDSFWLMATIVEDLLPASYYSSTLLGVQADQRVMQTLIANYLTVVDETLKCHDIELSLITLHWFLTIFANVVHFRILLRLVPESICVELLQWNSVDLISSCKFPIVFSFPCIFQNMGLVFLRRVDCFIPTDAWNAENEGTIFKRPGELSANFQLIVRHSGKY